MKNFNKESYLKIGKDTFALKPRVDEIVKDVTEKGYKNIFFIGSGGSYAMFIPFEYYMTTMSKIEAHIAIAAEIMQEGHNRLGKDSVCIFTSTSGTTKETVAAAKWARLQGATTICISGNADCEYAKEADYPIVNMMSDFSGADADYVLLYLLTFSFMHANGDYEDYEGFANCLSHISEALVDVKEECDGKVIDFAKKYAHENYHLLIGAGSLWGETYMYGMCVMEEMQWIRTKTVRASEFFHGTLEIVDENTNVMLIMGEDASRAQTDRVKNFLDKINARYTIFDTKEFALNGIDSKYRPLLSPIVMTAYLDRLSYALEEETGHSLDIRRYYKKMDY